MAYSQIEPPLSVQFNSISCSFQEKMAKIIGFWPHVKGEILDPPLVTSSPIAQGHCVCCSFKYLYRNQRFRQVSPHYLICIKNSDHGIHHFILKFLLFAKIHQHQLSWQLMEDLAIQKTTSQEHFASLAAKFHIPSTFVTFIKWL